MASVKLETTKDGRKYYRIRVRMGRSGTTLAESWYVPEGWSKRSIERELAKEAADFERRCKAGEVLTKKEKKARKDEEEKEAAKIKTLKQYGEQVFMPAKIITVAEHTRAYYQNALDKHIYPKLGDLKLTEITSAKLNSFFLELQGSELALSTIRGIYVAMSQLFKMIFLDDTITHNPMDKVARPKARKDEKPKTEAEADTFTPEELKTIIVSLENEPLKWRAMVRLMIDTGIRRGEACGLKWENIDLDEKTATIRENLCYTAAKGIYSAAPKTGKVRDVYFSEATKKLLKELQIQQINLIRKAHKDAGPDDVIPIPQFVFTTDGTANPIHPTSPTHYFRQFSVKYGIPDFHPHKLRHTFASQAIINGADIASVSEVLGHADKSTTLRMYTHADEQSKRKASAIVHTIVNES